MHYSRILCLVGAGSVALAGCSHTPRNEHLAKQTLTVHAIAPYTALAVPKTAVRKECRLEQNLPVQMRDAADGLFGKVVLADKVSETTPGAALELKIVGIDAPSGGPYTGGKAVVVMAVLRRDGRVVALYTITRWSSDKITTGVVYIGPQGTCGVLDRLTKEVADTAAQWLASPFVVEALTKGQSSPGGS